MICRLAFVTLMLSLLGLQALAQDSYREELLAIGIAENIVDELAAQGVPQEGLAQEQILITRADGEELLFTVDLAQSPRETMIGLMMRPSMPIDEGMLFLFEQEREQNFWMANTILPLDIIYIASDGAIVSIAENTTPFSRQSIPSNGPAQYVLELNAGASQAFGIAPGDVVSW